MSKKSSSPSVAGGPAPALYRAVFVIDPRKSPAEQKLKVRDESFRMVELKDLTPEFRNAVLISLKGFVGYERLADRLKEGRAHGLDANCLALAASTSSERPSFRSVTSGLKGLWASFVSRVPDAEIYQPPVAVVEGDGYRFELRLGHERGGDLRSFDEACDTPGVGPEKHDNRPGKGRKAGGGADDAGGFGSSSAADSRAHRIVLAERIRNLESNLSRDQAPLVARFQSFLDMLASEGTFGDYGANAAVATRVNQTAMKYGIDILCCNEKTGQWQSVRLRCIDPTGKPDDSGYFQARPVAQDRGLVYSGRTWPTLKAACRSPEMSEVEPR
jgi:hypothetical protein